MGLLHLTAAVLLLSSSHLPPCHSSERLGVGESISGNQTIISSGGIFAVGFFSLTDSAATPNWYVGMWHNRITERKIVWVANRANPLRKSPGVLRLSEDRNLVIVDADGSFVWSSNASSTLSSSNNTSAVLLDAGNLVLRDGESNDLWQSFEHPTDTILPGMRLTSIYKNKIAESITCWRSNQDPSPGNFSFGLDVDSPFQFLMKRGQEPYWRSQVWSGKSYVALTSASSNDVSYLTYSADHEWANVTFTFSGRSALSMFVLNTTGAIQLLQWNGTSEKWTVMFSQPSGRVCDTYELCGEFGVCDRTLSPSTCKCVEGFEPKNRTEWYDSEFHGGCTRKKALRCEDEDDGFVTLDQMKLPDHSIFIPNMSRSDCKKVCSGNCSCTAYAHYDSTGGRRFNMCYVWSGGLEDLVRSSDGNSMHLRLASSETGKGSKTKIIIVVVASVSASAILCIAFACFIFKRNKKKDAAKEELVTSGEIRTYERGTDPSTSHELGENFRQEGADLPFFDFEVLMAATDDFNDMNKIGRGGFGIVYKGKLANGLEIAIKRLSTTSGQGLEEFMNEVQVIAKLQHRNLVRLLGCCIEGGEKILIYEYLPNKSLDSILFSNEKRMLLDWEKRFNIIKGIARGLVYLHEDSRLRIIHRDLKASNILLDDDMSPKISDFGMARIFGGNQHEANTVRVVGTYGYMSPEYAMKGLFSAKSDVYSYGVLVLEILCGRKNTSLQLPFPSLISYAWHLWEDGRFADLADPFILHSCPTNEVLQCAHVALLCVQDRASDRPTMSSVAHALENASLPLDRRPKQPTFTAVIEEEDVLDQGQWAKIPQTFSISDVTITGMQGR